MHHRRAVGGYPGKRRSLVRIFLDRIFLLRALRSVGERLPCQWPSGRRNFDPELCGGKLLQLLHLLVLASARGK